MNTWTPVWSKLPDSSVWAESKEVKILFITMLALKDRDHIVRYNAFELARKANLSEAEVLEALKVLSSPDTRRLEPQDYDGRRIEKVEDGWLMLNGEKYRRKMQELYRKEYKRVKQAEYRLVTIPLMLASSPEFMTWWGRWMEHLKAKRKPPTFHSQELQLEKLDKLGIEKSIATIRHSIESGYQGLFEPQVQNQSKGFHPKITTQQDAVNRQLREMEEAAEKALRP